MLIIKDEYLQLIVWLIFAAIMIFLVFFTIKYLLPLVAPFILAIIISIINEPLIKLLEKKFSIKRKYGAILSLLLTLLILLVVVVIGAIKIYNELVNLQANFGQYINSISIQLNHYLDKLTTYYESLPYGIADEINNSLLGLISKIRAIIESSVKFLFDTLTSVPKITVFMTITLLASYFISSDKSTVSSFIYKQLPKKWAKNLSGIKNSAFAAVLAYIRAQLILVTFTFFEASIGLIIININYAITLGILIAISDLVPIFGTSIIMVPMIIWYLITGNIPCAIGVTIVYYIGVIMRQILEPKILGENLGLHPLVTLIVMYIGLSLYGVLGMFMALLFTITIKSVQDSGTFNIWKN